MAAEVIGEFPLGVINPGIATAVSLSTPALAQIDLTLTGPFGLNGLLSEVQAQFSAALSAQAQLSVAIGDPFTSLKSQLTAILQIQAQITASLALSLPVVSAQISANLSGAVAIAATLQLKLQGIKALIQAGLAVKLPLASFIASLDLNAGPLVLVSFGFNGPDTLQSTAAELAALLGGGVGGIAPLDLVQGVVILTKDPSAAAALSAIIKTQ